MEPAGLMELQEQRALKVFRERPELGLKALPEEWALKARPGTQALLELDYKAQLVLQEVSALQAQPEQLAILVRQEQPVVGLKV